MLSPTSLNATSTNLATHDIPTKISSDFVAASSADNEILILEEQIRLLDAAISPLRGKAKKKLAKIEDELENCNFLINTGLGSKDDKVALRKTKRQLRERRIKLWEELKVLPNLEDERNEAVRQLNALRRRHGILDISS